MALPLIPLLVAGVVVAVASALKGKGGTAATPTHKGGLIATPADVVNGVTRTQADGVAPRGANGIRVFVDEAKVALFKSLTDVGAVLNMSTPSTEVYRLTAGAPNRAQDVAITANQTQGRYLLMPIADAVGGVVPFLRLVAGVPMAGDAMGGLAIAQDAPDGTPAAYAIVALPGETAALLVKAGIPGGGEALPPLPAVPGVPGGGVGGADGAGLLAPAPGLLLPGDPYGVLAALGDTPGLTALGATGQKLKHQIANAPDPQTFRDLAAGYQAAGNPTVAAELTRAADLIQALHAATAKAAEWAGIKALPSPYGGRGLNLVAPLDYSALDDDSKPLCPGVATVDLPAMIAAVWAGKPWPTNPDGSSYTNAQMLPWLLSLTRGDGSLVFPDGPLMTTVPNPACPDVAEVQTFQNGLAAIGLVGPWDAELSKIAARLLPPIFPVGT